jgi:hypothetical protein
MEPFGRTLIAIGIVCIALGAWLLYGPSIPWLGRLPGDIRIERPGFKLFAPLATCLLLSALVSLVLYLLGKLR